MIEPFNKLVQIEDVDVKSKSVEQMDSESGTYTIPDEYVPNAKKKGRQKFEIFSVLEMADDCEIIKDKGVSKGDLIVVETSMIEEFETPFDGKVMVIRENYIVCKCKE